jgi:hypothetical protein
MKQTTVLALAVVILIRSLPKVSRYAIFYSVNKQSYQL